MSTPEIKGGELPEREFVKEQPEVVEIPQEIEHSFGVKPTPTQISAVVTDDSGGPMMTSPATQSITITLPASTSQLSIWAKGSPSEALTWLAAFWLRLVKKAMHFGWNIMTVGQGTNKQS